MKIDPHKIYYEKAVLEYQLGQELHEKYKDREWIEIENHNNIPCLRQNPNSEFAKMKQDIVIGVRKSLKHVPNNKTSDFLVPYTSSGCMASCLYCYLVCNYNKCSYLRLFVNREQMLKKIIDACQKSDKDLVFEIGSNSDLVLENEITGNLNWTIENFAKVNKGFITFPTKFHMIDPILNLEHNRRTIVRMSMNPEYIISKVELGTSKLTDRIEAINKLCEKNYRVGILIAPVILLQNWQSMYIELLTELKNKLSDKAKKDLPIEIIFMTYSYVHRMINNEAFPNAVELYDKEMMTGRGMGRYCYNKTVRSQAEEFFKEEVPKYLPEAKIEYIV